MTTFDSDFTLTSPLSDIALGASPLLAVTIIWHPDHGRIGEQFVGTAGPTVIELSRYFPLFCAPGSAGLALGHAAISRDPLRITRDADDRVVIHPPASRMVAELNGEVIDSPRQLTAQQIEAGQVIGMGRTVLLCLHWMRGLPKNNPVPGMAGVSTAAILARDQLRLVAATELPVLLLGETGTGKEIAARAIHALGARSRAALVTVNMAALNESLAAADLFGAAKGAYTGAQVARKGLFDEAAGATLFLDEIGNTPASVQPMLLRVLEGGDYRPLGAQQDCRSSARLIAATDQDLGSDAFNQALLRRLESFVIRLPPLRARREDIGVLLVCMLGLDQAHGGAVPAVPFALVSDAARYDWPGNIRQLGNVVKRAVLALQAGQAPDFDRLVESVSQRPDSSARLTRVPATPLASVRKRPADLAEQDILNAMENSGWTIQAAAHALGVSRPTMYKLLDTHAEIRRAESIPASEIREALQASGGDLRRCASQLKTPSEALRRHLHTLGLSVG